jgi:glycosyltransferase involved in cell wall biosynthesis
LSGRRGRAQSRAVATVRHLPLAAYILRSHLARDRWTTAWLAWRVLPRSIRRPLLSPGVVRGSVVGALGLAAEGRRFEARHTLLGLAERGPVRSLLSVASAATAVGEQSAAWCALARARRKGPTRSRVEALLLWSEGHLRRAVSVAGGNNGQHNRRLITRMEGDLSCLMPERRVPKRVDGHLPVQHKISGSAATVVLHVVTNALPEVQAGYTLRTHGIAEAQAAKGHEVWVATRLGFPVDIGVLGAPDRLRLDGVNYQRLLPSRGVTSSAGTRLDQGIHALEQLVTKLRPDLLHAHSKHDNAQLSLAVGRRVGLPVLYEVRGFLEETWRSRGGNPDSDRYQMSRDAERWCMEQADLVVTLSETMRVEILRRGIHPSHVMVVPNSVSKVFLEPLPDGAAARRRLGIGEATYVLGVVSTLTDYEGVQTLVDAVRLIDDPAVHLLVVGAGPAADDLRRSSVDLAGRITFTGRVPHADIRPYYAAIDTFCVPRRRTPVTELVAPLKPLEALASGVPLLVSDLPPLLELLSESDAGWSAPADVPEAWAAQIHLLQDQGEERRAKGRQARVWVREHRTWPILADTYDMVYSRLRVRTTPARSSGRRHRSFT